MLGGNLNNHGALFDCWNLGRAFPQGVHSFLHMGHRFITSSGPSHTAVPKHFAQTMCVHGNITEIQPSSKQTGHSSSDLKEKNQKSIRSSYPSSRAGGTPGWLLNLRPGNLERKPPASTMAEIPIPGWKTTRPPNVTTSPGPSLPRARIDPLRTPGPDTPRHPARSPG